MNVILDGLFKKYSKKEKNIPSIKSQIEKLNCNFEVEFELKEVKEASIQ